MENESPIHVLRAYTLREIAKNEGRSYQSVLSSKKRGEYVRVVLMQGRDLSGRTYETKLATESGADADTVKWEGKDGRRTVERYLSREDSKVLLAIKSVSSLSPKLPSSGNRAYSVLVDSPKADFKFVIGDANDLFEMERLLDSMERRPSADRVWLMPLGTDAESQTRLAKELVIPYALDHGYNLSLRQQIVLFGDVKGT